MELTQAAEVYGFDDATFIKGAGSISRLQPGDEERLEYVPKRGRWKREGTGLSSRNEKIVQRRLAGVSLEAIAREFGITRERVRQIVRAEGKTQAVNDAKLAAQQARVHQRNIDELIRRLNYGVKCAIPNCGAWVVRFPNKIAESPPSSRMTCSQECAKIWVQYRYQIDDDFRDQQRRSIAEWAIRNPDSVRPSYLRAAEKCLLGRPTTGVRFVRTAERQKTLRELGIEVPHMDEVFSGRHPWLSKEES